MHPQPSRRSTHVSGGPRNLLVYDRWGRFGRPVLLLHGLLFDRTMWWPLAAEMSGCTVLAPDLPGHGDTPVRAFTSIEDLVRDLAGLVGRLDLHRAPIVVGHATAAPLATAFGERFAVREVLTIDEGDENEVPECFRVYATPKSDDALLTTYANWPVSAGRAAGRPAGPSFPHLADPAGFAAGLTALLP